MEEEEETKHLWQAGAEKIIGCGVAGTFGYILNEIGYMMILYILNEIWVFTLFTDMRLLNCTVPVVLYLPFKRVGKETVSVVWVFTLILIL